jgi:hypothetical protein
MVDSDYIMVDSRLDEMVGHYKKECKYFYLVDEQLWYFPDVEAFERIHQELQSGFRSELSKDELLFIEDRDQFVALHARLFMEPAMEFGAATEPFRFNGKDSKKAQIK